MTWVSERNLVSAISNAGGFGVIASGSMSPELLVAEIAATKALTERPFGVNLITLHPQLRRADRGLRRRIGSVMSYSRAGSRAVPRCAESRRAARGFSASRPRSASRASSCAWAPTRSSSRAARRAGISDRSRPECWRRRFCRIFTRFRCSSPAASGAAKRLLAYLEMGAAGVQLGTRFVCADELIAHPRFKQAFIRAAARDAVASLQLDPRFPVIPVRALANPATERFLAVQRQRHRSVYARRAVAKGGTARDRAFLGRRTASRGDRRRRRGGLADGGAKRGLRHPRANDR